MLYDTGLQEAIAPAGAGVGGVDLADCWGWNGSSWGARGVLPQGRSAFAAAFDPIRGVGVLFGGSIPGTSDTDHTLERLNGTWTIVSPSVAPPPRRYASMAYDRQRSRIVMFGGVAGNAYVGDTWEYDGQAWSPTSPGLSPSPRGTSLAYDPTLQAVILFGGGDHTTSFNDTWVWNGITWALLQPPSRPVARGGHVLVETGSRVLLCGGRNVAATYFSDLWEWNGQNWVLLESPPPSARSNYGAAYDVRRDRTVVFGGMTTNNRASASYNNETWEWDGDSWLQRFPANAPSPRGWCKLTFDMSRSRVVLFGGADAANTFQDTWEWDGSDWVQQTPIANPPGSFGHDLTYDSARHMAIAYGGLGTWDYGPVVAARVTAYGSGCATSASTPAGSPLALKPLPWSGPWLGDRLEMEFQNQPLGLGIFLWGFSNQMSAFGPLPFPLALFGSPNCWLLASAEATELIFPGTTRYTSFVLPNHPSFLGAKMYGQAGFFDQGLPGVPVVTSNGLEMVFGQK